LYRPTPASQPEPHAFGSPVPTQSVSLCLSFGSSWIDAVLLCSKTRDRYFHWGLFASASSVRQTPPFAFAIQRRQDPPPSLPLPWSEFEPRSFFLPLPFEPQLGSIASWAMRPLKLGVPAV